MAVAEFDAMAVGAMAAVAVVVTDYKGHDWND